MGSVELKDLIGPTFFFSFAFALDTGTTTFLYSKSLCYNNSKEGFKTHFQLAFVFMHFLKANIKENGTEGSSAKFQSRFAVGTVWAVRAVKKNLFDFEVHQLLG